MTNLYSPPKWRNPALFILLCVFITIPATVFAIPASLSHQGRILGTNGEALTGSANTTFTLYDSPDGSQEVWSEITAVTFDNGYYTVVLGNEEALDPSDFDGSTLYLGITLEGSEEFSPRNPITSVPYAFLAGAVRGEVIAENGLYVGDNQIIDDQGNWVGSEIGVDYLPENFDTLNVAGDTHVEGNISTSGNLSSTGTFTLPDSIYEELPEPSASPGQMFYVTDHNGLYYSNGTDWIPLGMNQPPIWLSQGGDLGEFREAVPIYIQLEADDPEGQSLVFTLRQGSSLPSGLELTSEGVIQGEPDMIDSTVTTDFTLRVTDTGQPTQHADLNFSMTVRDPIPVVFDYTGEDQDWVVPEGVSTITCHLWGAGGGTSSDAQSDGGAGGYTTGDMEVSENDQLKFVVGIGGSGNSNGTYAFYGGAGGGVGGNGGGGGYAGIFFDSVAQDKAILIAGGGGAAGYQSTGDAGNGGGEEGQLGADGTANQALGGAGGTQSAGGAGGYGARATGTDGVALQGGYSSNTHGGGGGGGYYGGGAGGEVSGPDACGGGGSGYIGGTDGHSVSNASTDASPYGTRTPPETNNLLYSSGVGVGGTGPNNAGGPGKIVILY